MRRKDRLVEPAAGPDDEQLRVDVTAQQCECFEEQRQILAWLQRADEQQIRPAWIWIKPKQLAERGQSIARSRRKSRRSGLVHHANPRWVDTQQSHRVRGRPL